MQAENEYKPSKDYRKKNNQESQDYASYLFYLEIDRIKGIEGLSDEMKLTIELSLRFQWAEERLKDLIWYLYSATSGASRRVYLNDTKRERIQGLKSRQIGEELLCFTSSAEPECFADLSKIFVSITKARNDITHKLYTSELRQKARLIYRLKVALRDIVKLNQEIDRLENIYGFMAAIVEMRHQA
jgi:hypothetical protein